MGGQVHERGRLRNNEREREREKREKERERGVPLWFRGGLKVY